NKTSSKNFDKGVYELTNEIYQEELDFRKVKILLDGGFRISTASVILNVLYPERFTVFAYRDLQRDELKSFQNLDNASKLESKGNRYLNFVKAVKNLEIELDFKVL
ncbi:unnamed protein product, partial [marine sediment metagenome]